MQPCGYVICVSLIQLDQLCESIRIQENGPCIRISHFTLPRPFNHRPYTLSIQWLHVRFAHPVYCFRPREEVATQWYPLRGAALHEAHLPLLGASILRLPPSSLLSLPALDFPNTILQLFEAWDKYRRHVRSRLRPLCVLGADAATDEQVISVFKGLVPCLLGT
jgi:hypothetical protein